MLDANGKPVERYDYTPYGKRYIWVDLTPPSVEQVRLEDGVVYVELSEEVREDVLRPTLNQGLVLENLTANIGTTHFVSLQYRYHPLRNSQGESSEPRGRFGSKSSGLKGAREFDSYCR